MFNREDFYKVLLGLLTERETVLLSTHLIEEVSGFIGRAVLLRDGVIIGDTQTEELPGSLLDYVKTTYHYRADRVAKTIEEMEGET